MTRAIVIEFLGKDKSLSSTARSAETSTSRLGDTLKRVGKVAAVGLAAGAVVAGKAMFDMTKMAIEDQASQEALARTLKNTTGATDEQVGKVEEWISAQGKALGVADDELRPALQRLAEATGDVGEAQKLASLAMDVSAGTGKSLKTVSEALMKAQNGQVSGLSRLGIETKNAKGETLNFEQATQKMADTFEGQAAAKADTLEGKMGRLKLIFDETREEIGAKLLPVVTRLADWFLNEGLPAVTKFGEWVRDNLGPIFERVREIVKKAMGSLRGDVGGRLDDVRSIIRDFVSITRTVWRNWGDEIRAVTKFVWRLQKGIIGDALKVIAGLFRATAALLKGDWRGLGDALKNIIKGAAEAQLSIIRGLFGALRGLFRAQWSVVKGIVGAAWDGIKSLVRNGVDGVIGVVKSIGSKVSAVAGGLFDGLVSSFRNAINAIIRGWNSLSFSIPGIDPPGPGKIPGVTVSTPNIPYLAQGGVVKARRGGTLALLGEGGHDEAVVPLTGPYARRATGQTGPEQTVVIPVVLKLDGRTIHQSLLKLKRDKLGGLSLGLA